MLACTLAFAAGLAAGLGDPVTVVFALPFELSAVLQLAQKTASISKASKAVIRRIEVPPV